MKYLKKIITYICVVAIALSLFACKKTTYTITFNTGEHGEAMDSITYTLKEPFDFEDPVRKNADTSKGYTFSGWFASETFLGSPVYSTEDVSGNATIYADWKIAEYAISYALNGNTNSPAKAGDEAPTSYTYFAETNLVSPTRTGYEFVGWYANSALTDGPYTSIAQGQEGDKRFYAKWNALAEGEYQITYVLNGGKLDGSYPQKYLEGTEVTLVNPARTGYTFDGWYTASEGGTLVTKVASTDTGAKTFYARWTIIDYNLVFNVDGGTMPATYKQTYTYTDPVFFLPTPTKSNLDFGGWYTNVGLTGSVVSYIKANSTGAREYFAKWINKTTNSAVTYKYEAENVDLSEFVGSGYSGAAKGSEGIFLDTAASGGKYVGYINDPGQFIDYLINSDRAVSGATIELMVNFEMIKGQYTLVDVMIGPSEFSVIVAGEECTYTPTLVKSTDDPGNAFYTKITVNNVKLVAGANIIKLRTNGNTLWGGERNAGPGIDYINIITTATLNWTPIIW